MARRTLPFTNCGRISTSANHCSTLSCSPFLPAASIASNSSKDNSPKASSNTSNCSSCLVGLLLVLIQDKAYCKFRSQGVKRGNQRADVRDDSNSALLNPAQNDLSISPSFTFGNLVDHSVNGTVLPLVFSQTRQGGVSLEPDSLLSS